MKYGKVEYVDKPVSRIIMGTAMPPFMMGGDGNALLDGMFSLGVNTLDTARNYRNSEVSVGNWMEARGNRDQIVLITKCGHPNMLGKKRVNEKDMQKDLRTSLEKLRTDYIDIYLLHRDDPKVPVGQIVEIFNDMHARGQIRAFGGSNWSYQRVAQANEYAYAHNLIPFAASSPNFGLADQVRDPWGGGCETISGPSHEADRAWYAETKLPVIAYSSLARGLFAGKLKYADRENASKYLDPFGMKGYVCEENFERLRRCEELADRKNATVAQIAMAWIHHQQLNTFAVVSTSSKERMQQNIQALSLELTAEEAAYLDLKSDVL